MLDHGILNLPLAKRQGNIDAEIDRWKADRQRQERLTHRERVAQHKAQKAEALQKIAVMPDTRAVELMAKYKLTRKQLNKRLRSIAHYTPTVILQSI